MKKIITAAVAALMCMNMISCSKGDNSNLNSSRSFTAEKLSDKAYKKIKVPLPENLNTLYSFKTSPKGHMIIGTIGSESPVFFTCDTNCENFTRVDFEDFSIGENYDICLASDGTMIAFINEKNEENEEYSYWIRKYARDGNLISSNEVTELYEQIPPTSLALDGMYCADGEHAIVEINGSVYSIGTNGNFLGELTLSNKEHEIKEFGMDNKNQLWCTVKVDIDNIKLCKVDAKNGKIDENGNTYNIGGSIITPIAPGTGEYSMYLMGRTQIFGIKDNGEIEPVFDITGSDLNTNQISGFCFNESGQLLAPLINYTSAKFYKYVECDPSELENLPVVTIGTCNKEMWQEWVSQINDEQNDYIVKIIDYSNNTINSGSDNLRDALISGEAPDIIDSDIIAKYCLEEKGMFCDLYDFIDKDNELNRDAFNQNILSLMEHDGNIYTMYKNFFIDTIFGKTKFVGDKENWTADDYIKACENRPDDMEAFIYNVYSNAIYADSFVDPTEKKCYFDSDQFLKVMEYTAQQPDNLVNNWERITFADPNKPTKEELDMVDAFSNEENLAYANDKVMLTSVYFGDFQSYFMIREEKFGGDDITNVGYLTPEGGQSICSFLSGLSIYANSPNKDYAWDFIKKFITEDLEGRYTSEGFYVLNNRLEQQAETALEPQSYEDDPDYHGYFSYITQNPVKIGMPANDDIEYVWNLINNLSVTTSSLSDTVYSIYFEERDKFFNKEYTADELSEILQNRLSIAVTE